MPAIDSCAVGEIRAGLAANRHRQVQASLSDVTFSLGSLLEISAWLHESAAMDLEGCSVLRAVTGSATSPICSLLSAERRGPVALNCVGKAEISSITHLTSSDKPWLEYLMRFHEALVVAGYEKSYARALSYSFHEMADNVRQHAGLRPGLDLPSVAGWHVVNGVAAFAVVDLGRGVKSSLQTNSAWAHLTSDRDALLAVLRERATRKAGNTFGDGFNEVVQNFVSRNGCLAVRSGESEVVATGTIVDGIIRVIPRPAFRGTRVAAWCAPSHTTLPPEPVLKILS